MRALSVIVKSWLWPVTEPEGALGRGLLVVARYLYAIGRDLSTGDINLRAMSLVYTSMISIVPLFGFAFALAKALGFEDQLQPKLQDLLQPLGPEYSVTLSTRVDSFAANINGGVLGIVSLALLLITVMSMAQKVEGSFNFVWRVDRPRNFAQRFSEYLSVILIGPTIMLAATSMLASLESTWVVSQLSQMAVIGPIVMNLGRAVPYLMIIAAFTFLYMFIPNTRVLFVPALIGGILGGLAWSTSGFLFAKLVVVSAGTKSIYGGAAIVLILMFWMYISWVVLLLGSALVFYLQNPYQLRHGQRTEAIDNDARERLCLAVMSLVANDYVKPSHGWTSESLASALRVPRESLEPIIANLTASELLVMASEKRLIPGRDPHHVTLRDIVATVRGRNRDRIDSSEAWRGGINDIVDRIDDAIAAQLDGRTLGQLVDAHLARDESH